MLWLAVCIHGELRSVAVILMVLDGIFLLGPLIDGSSRLCVAVCIHGELSSVAVILLVLDGIFLRGSFIDGSSRLWLAVCIHGELRSAASCGCFEGLRHGPCAIDLDVGA